MDNIRKELIKLIHHCTSCEVCHDADIADHLIVNGVTVQDGEDNNVPTKWIPVTERLPDRDGKYLVFKDLCSSPYNVTAVWFAENGEKVSKYNLAGEKNVWYEYDSEYGHISCDCVTHWMPLPQPPKGE